MTLCLAWKRGHSISFASDSRLSGPSGINSDMATKIYKVSVRVIKSDTKELVHDLSYGLCFCGSYLNGSVVADTINEILSSLQIRKDVEIDGKAIVNIAFEVFKDISSHLMSLHGINGLSRILIGGQCPISKEVNIYHFNWKYADWGAGIEFTMTPEAFDPPFLAIGDSNATALANELIGKISYDKAPQYTEYHLLKDVIDDEKIYGVGGAIQTGHFIQGSFRLFGMVDYELGSITPGSRTMWAHPVYTYLGMPISNALKADDRFKIDTSKVFMDPFTDKRKELERQAKEINGLKG